MKTLLILCAFLLSGCVSFNVNLGGTINNVTVIKSADGGAAMLSKTDAEENNPARADVRIVP